MLLGTATTGIWLASTGLVRLERRFVLALGGSCSFCGKDRAEVQTLVGTFGRPEKICDECAGLCCEIIAEELEHEDPAWQPTPPSPEEEARLAEILRSFDVENVERLREKLLADARHLLEPQNVAVAELHCTFCGAHRRDVRKLISGPRVFICDLCVADATAVVGHVLRA